MAKIIVWQSLLFQQNIWIFLNVNRVKVLHILKDFLGNIFHFFQLKFLCKWKLQICKSTLLLKIINHSKYLQPFCPSPIDL